MDSETKAVINEEVMRLSLELASLVPGTKEYEQVAKNLEILAPLSSIPEDRKEKKWWEKILDNGPLVSALGTLTLGGAMLWHERAEIITSRVAGMLRFRN